MIIISVITPEDLFYFVQLLFLVLLGLLASFFFGWWMNKRQYGLSPYTGKILRKGSDLPFVTVEKVLRFLFEMHQYDNKLFDIKRAAICRQTGRIFQDCITWFGTIHVGWDFIQQRYPGNYVSWGSLSREQKDELWNKHGSIEGFQIEFSSDKPSPKDVEKVFVYTKPGPLYVDLNTGVLVGWKSVPDTDLEILIVQKPKS